MDEHQDAKKHHKVGTYVRHPKGSGRVTSVHHNQLFYGISHPTGVIYMPGREVQSDPDHDGDNDLPGGNDPDHDPVPGPVQQVGDMFHVRDTLTGDTVATLTNEQAAWTVHDALASAGILTDRDFNAGERKKLAASGASMPDGSFPTPTKADWMNARQALGRTDPAKRAKVIAYLKRRAKTLGIPDSELPGAD